MAFNIPKYEQIANENKVLVFYSNASDNGFFRSLNKAATPKDDEKFLKALLPIYKKNNKIKNGIFQISDYEVIFIIKEGEESLLVGPLEVQYIQSREQFSKTKVFSKVYRYKEFKQVKDFFKTFSLLDVLSFFYQFFNNIISDKCDILRAVLSDDFVEEEAVTFDKENAFFSNVAAGDVETVKSKLGLLIKHLSSYIDDEGGHIPFAIYSSYLSLLIRAASFGGLLFKQLEARKFKLMQLLNGCASEEERLSLISTFTTIVTEEVAEKKKEIRPDITLPINKAITYIHEHIYGKITLESAAEELGISSKYLSALFVKEMKVGFTDYVHKCKIEAACDLLKNSDETLVNIAIKLGYTSQSYFTQDFKKYLGVTPKRYRQAD